MATSLMGDPFRRLFMGSPVYLEIPGLDPPMDWLESPNSHCFKLNVPGYGKENIKVEVDEENVLHIRGIGRGEQGQQGKEKEKEDAQNDTVWHSAERAKARGFHRAIQLPDKSKVEHIKAQLENGVLTILVPKDNSAKQSKARTIHISTKL